MGLLITNSSTINTSVTVDTLDIPPTIGSVNGSLYIVNNTLYAYLESQWLPIVREVLSINYIQSTSLSTWVINHNFGSSNLWISVFDSSNNLITPLSVQNSLDGNTTTIYFNAGTIGSVIILSPLNLSIYDVVTNMTVGSNTIMIDATGININNNRLFFTYTTGAFVKFSDLNTPNGAAALDTNSKLVINQVPNSVLSSATINNYINSCGL
jgi:hypothetical protein